MQGGTCGTENCDGHGLMYSAWPIRVGWVAGSGWMPIWLTNADQLRSAHAEPGSQSNQPQSARVTCGSSVKRVFWIWSLRPGCSKVSWDLWNGTILGVEYISDYELIQHTACMRNIHIHYKTKHIRTIHTVLCWSLQICNNVTALNFNGTNASFIRSILIQFWVGVTKPNSSIPLFSEFYSIVKTHVSYCISRLYLAGVATAQLRWHLSNMNVNQRI